MGFYSYAYGQRKGYYRVSVFLPGVKIKRHLNVCFDTGRAFSPLLHVRPTSLVFLIFLTSLYPFFNPATPKERILAGRSFGASRLLTDDR